MTEIQTMRLPQALTDQEVLARGRELARLKDEHGQAQVRLEESTDDWKSARKRMEEKVEGFLKDMAELSRVIRSGHEDRDVPVYDVPDYDTGVIFTKRSDTNEVVKSRGMTEADRQRSMFRALPPGDVIEAEVRPNDEAVSQ